MVPAGRPRLKAAVSPSLSLSLSPSLLLSLSLSVCLSLPLPLSLPGGRAARAVLRSGPSLPGSRMPPRPAPGGLSRPG